MKSVLSQIICLFFSLHFLSAQAPDVLWATNVEGIGLSGTLSIAVEEQTGNIYTTGYFMNTFDFDPGDSVYLLTSEGGWDIYISKVDRDGNFLWAVSVGAENDDWGTSIALDGAGGVYVTGGFERTVDFDPGAQNFNITSNGHLDGYVLKLDSNGNFVSAKNFGGPVRDVWSQSIVIDPSESGGIYLSGQFAGMIDFDPGPDSFLLSSQGSIDVFVVRMDHSGNLIWAKGFGSTGQEYAGKSAIDPVSKIIYTTGSFAGTADFDPGSNVFELTSEGKGDVFVISLDNNGDLNWVKSIGGQGAERSYSIAVNHKGGGEVYVTGSFEETADFDPDESANFHLTSEGVGDAFLLKLDNTGQFIWAKAFSGLLKQEGSDLVLDPSGNGDVYATGEFWGDTDFDPSGPGVDLNVKGEDDIYMVKIDGAGNLNWIKGMGSPGLDQSYSLAIDGNRHLHMGGLFFGTEISFDGIILLNEGFSDPFLVKFDMLTTQVENPLLAEINIFPNPVSDELTFEFEEDKLSDVEVTLYNMLGQIVFSGENKKMEQKKTIDISAIFPGIYLVELKFDGTRIMKKVVKE